MNTLRKGQLSEALFGSTELLAKAMGVTEKELFKQMESGKVIAAEVLPLLAKEYRKAARANGAFEAASKKTRAELNRFMGELSLFKNEIFAGGFGDGLSYMFKGMADILAGSKDLATMFGLTLRSALATITLPFELLGVVLKHVSSAFNIAESEASRFLFKALGIAAALWSIVKAGKMIASVVGVGKTITTAMGGAGAGSAASTAARAAGGFAGLGASLIAEPLLEAAIGDTSFGKWAKKTEVPIESFFPIVNQLRMANRAIDVLVTVNDGKVEGLIDAKVVQSNAENLNNIMASGTK